MRNPIVVAILTLSLVAAACGDDDSAETSQAAAASTTSAESATTTTEPATSTVAETTVVTTTTTTMVTTTTTEAARPFAGDLVMVLDRDSWGRTHALAGAVLEYDGVFHFFYTAGDANGTNLAIGHATSTDGYTWTRPSEDWLLLPEDVPYNMGFIYPSSAVILDDGTWAMFFHTSGGLTTRRAVIGRATAPGPEGPWTVDPEPVLDVGESEAWDSGGVGYPMVLPAGDGYLMWYDGHRGDQDQLGDRSIGLATSSDGAVFTRHDDPSTTDPLFAGGDPVLATTPGTWDAERVFDPNVVATGGGFVMVYSTANVRSSRFTTGYGFAFSEDGIAWEKGTGEGFGWTVDAFPASQRSLGSMALAEGEQLLLYFDLLFTGYGETYVVPMEVPAE